MPVTRPMLYLGLSLVFALHNAEEATFAPAMLTFLQTRAPDFLRAFYSGVTAGQLRTGLLLLTLIGTALGLLAARSGTSAAWSYAMLVFGAVLALNAVAHVALAVAAARFMPGLVTALALCLPISGVLFVRARRERWVGTAALWSAPAVAMLVHGPLLAAFLRIVVFRFRGWTFS